MRELAHRVVPARVIGRWMGTSFVLAACDDRWTRTVASRELRAADVELDTPVLVQLDVEGTPIDWWIDPASRRDSPR